MEILKARYLCKDRDYTNVQYDRTKLTCPYCKFSTKTYNTFLIHKDLLPTSAGPYDASVVRIEFKKWLREYRNVNT